MTKEQLIKKVYRCIDETYPDTTEQDLEEFNIPAFLDEAVRWVVKAVPVGALGEGYKISNIIYDLEKKVVLPSGFLRLLRVKCKEWKTAVVDARPETDPKYWQQQNPALCGSNSRPIAFLTNGGTHLDIFPKGTIDELRVFRMDYSTNIGGDLPVLPLGETIDDTYTQLDYTNYPDKLLDITAWKTAELVFTMMQDTNGVAAAQAQIQNIMPTL